MQNQEDKKSAKSPADSASAAAAVAGQAAQNDFVQKIVEKIKGSENILIALSKDPVVDELAAAVGLTLFLDGMQKHVTAIYSGRTPDELAFLQPGETFEKTTDGLQDFIISLNKDKADHLRYKLEGDFVKVFITPYKARLTEDDLTFSHGDYNVDFVIAMNVPSGADLDVALHEHGRIMHDASVVNITTGEAGKFGEIEWSNPMASSLCEMVTGLVFALQGSDEQPLENDVATALLTGIVAATDRFSNNRTNPDTLGVASKLMAMGADQQLITANVHGNDRVENVDGGGQNKAKRPKDLGAMEVEHDEGIANPMTAPMNPAAEAAAPMMAAMNSATVVNPMAEVANPAAQMAPSVGLGGAPEPTAVSGTNNVTAESVIVQPVMPGTGDTLVLPGMNMPGGGGAVPTTGPVTANAGGVAQSVVPTGQNDVAAGADNAVMGANVAPAQQIDPSEMRLPGVNMAVPASEAQNTASRPMATSEPTVPTEKPVGTAIEPPVAEPKKPKNYAEMMEEALAEPMPGMATAAVPAVSMPAGGASGEALGATQNEERPSTMEILTRPAATGIGVPPVMEAAKQMNATAGGSPAMEPVANPMNETLLPPPPVPNVGDGNMMPPVLPPVVGVQ